MRKNHWLENLQIFELIFWVFQEEAIRWGSFTRFRSSLIGRLLGILEADWGYSCWKLLRAFHQISVE